MAVATSKDERLTQVETEAGEIKGEYGHLAARAHIAEVKGELRLLKGMFGIQVAAQIAFGTATLNYIYG